MKKIFFFILILVSVNVFSQYPANQYLGSDSTLVTSRGAHKSRLVNHSYTDTTQANAERISQHPGAQIFTTSDNKLWVRNSLATAWVDLTASGGSESTTVSSLGGGLDIQAGLLGTDIRINTLDAADFNSASNLITIDGAKWLTIAAGDAAYQPLNTNLTTIAGLAATTDNFIQSKAGAWASRTIAEVKTDLGLTGTNSGDQTISLTGDVTGSGTGSFAATIADNSVDGSDIALGTDAAGDLMMYNGTDWIRVAIGTNGQLLKVNATATAVEYFTPTYVTTRDRFGKIGEDEDMTENREADFQSAYRFNVLNTKTIRLHAFQSINSAVQIFDMNAETSGADGSGNNAYLTLNNGGTSEVGFFTAHQSETSIDPEFAIWSGRNIPTLTYGATINEAMIRVRPREIFIRMETTAELKIRGLQPVDDTTNWKPLVWNSTDSTVKKFSYWPSGGAGGDMVLASVQTNTGTKTFLDGTMLLRNVANTFNGVFTNTNTADRTYTLQNADGTLAFLSDITGTNSGTNTGDQTINNTSDATSHTVTLSSSGGTIQFIEGTNITLTTGGTGSAGTLTITASGGSGDVTKVGTPANNQMAVWTGDGTIEGTANLTYDGTTYIAASNSRFTGGLESYIGNQNNVRLGRNALAAITTGTLNVAIGDGAGQNRTGDALVAVGYQAANNSVANTSITAIGYQAAMGITGNDNTAVGRSAMDRSGGTGSENTAVGVFTLRGAAGLTGSGNSAFGSYAGNSMTSGMRNMAFGSSALLTVTTSNDNVAVGWSAGRVITGSQNVIIGSSAGYTATGTGNVFIGFEAGYSELGNYKLYIGWSAATPLIYGEFDNSILRVTGQLQVTNLIRVTEIATPATPATGTSAIYPKADGLWYGIDDAGLETLLSNAGGAGEANTASNLGGGLANFDSKSVVDLRFNTFAAADFDLATNVISIDATKWLTISAGDAAYQPLNANLTTIAGLTATTGNFIVSEASAWASRTPAQVKTTLALDNVTNESKATMFTNATFTGTFNVADGAIANADLANGAVANLSGTNTGDQTTIVGITGTTAQFNTALTDNDFATLDGIETLTNKSIVATQLTGTIDIARLTAVKHSPTITIETPTATENIGLFFTTQAITIEAVRGVMIGSSQSITFAIHYGASRATSDGTIVASNTFDSGDTGYQTTGFAFTLNTTAIPANSWIWITSSATSGTINDMSITVTYSQ